jgi:hypothetical protein
MSIHLQELFRFKNNKTTRGSTNLGSSRRAIGRTVIIGVVVVVLVLVIGLGIALGQPGGNSNATTQTNSSSTLSSASSSSSRSTSSSSSSSSTTSTTSRDCAIIFARNCVEILSKNQYVDSVGYTHIVGEVKNNGTTNLDFVQITATFYSSNGSVLDTNFAFTMMNILTPNQKSPFDVLSAKQGVAADHYSVTVTDASETTDQPDLALVVQGTTSSIDQVGYYHVLGEVKNTGNSTASLVEVVVTLHDSSGNVVDATLSFTTPSDLQAGESGSFDSITSQSASSISTFTVQAQPA